MQIQPNHISIKLFRGWRGSKWVYSKVSSYKLWETKKQRTVLARSRFPKVTLSSGKQQGSHRPRWQGEGSSRRSHPNQVRILWLSHAEDVQVSPACLINLTCREQRPWRVVIPSIVITSITVLHLTAGCGVTVGHVLGLGPHEKLLHDRVESGTNSETRASS